MDEHISEKYGLFYLILKITPIWDTLCSLLTYFMYINSI